jgi:uncharacterized protein DUF6985
MSPVSETLHHPRLGDLVLNNDLGGYASDVMPIASIGGHHCRFVLAEYIEDPNPEEIDAAIAALLAPATNLLAQAQPHVVQYREDMLSLEEAASSPGNRLAEPRTIWTQVRLGDTLYVSRRGVGDAEDGVYVSLECNCDWEIEHGLQLVARAGAIVSRIGPYDGHLTNADAVDDRTLVDVVYRALER